MRSALVLVAALVAACGSTGLAAAPDDGGADATPSDGGCITPTVGRSCTSTDVACQPADACCAGYLWTCDPSAHTWTKSGLGCACFPHDAGADAPPVRDAGPFACGTNTCGGDTYCADHPPGIRLPDGGVPPDSFTCTAIPAGCAATPTCACIESTLSPGDPCSTRTPGATCTDDGSGHVTLHCLGV